MLEKTIRDIAKKAREASFYLANVSTDKKNKALNIAAQLIDERREEISEVNREDVREAERKGVSKAFIDRLTLTEKRINGMVKSLNEVSMLEDPVGTIIRGWKRPNGLQILQMRVPIGVIGIIYESRPNVTVEASSLCLKTGNATILRGGREAINSNRILYTILSEAVKRAGLPEGCIGFIDSVDRKAIKYLIRMNGLVNLIIPRGGEGLINFVTENATVPVIKHYKGLCHTYVDEFASLPMAQEIVYNAKVQRPGVCNAIETLLVHKNIAGKFLPEMIRRLQEAGVEIRGCERTRKVVPQIREAEEKDWDTEYLDLILSIKVVDDIEEAIEHINKHGSQHSEAIITENYERAMEFLYRVDAATVYVNSSTRFTDGGEFGMGAEIGISTDKMHARGPMGLPELTTYKYLILGNGQIRK
ncbi:MAG: glutamate-5-semialdehyde dehydrogenase [Candidatus Cloacimonas sp. 4484_209]|nr:MAG: glutamate-5-semialdehyde dehydrogenase [Candidatus Cloacimonas sp. 4484_209]